MQKALFISEKDSTLKSSQQVYNHMDQTQLDYEIVAFVPLRGNVVEFTPPPKGKFTWEQLPYIPDGFKNYPFTTMQVDPRQHLYQAIPGKESYLANLKKALQKHPDIDFVIVGTDSDREGSNIWQSTWNSLPLSYQKIPHKRFFVNDMTTSGIESGFKNLLNDDYQFPNGTIVGNIYKAGILRAQLDKVIGFSYTPALTLKTKTLVRAGRVKLPTLNLVVQRELENKNFVPTKFWTLKMKFIHPHGKYTGELLDQQQKTRRFLKESEAQQALQNLADQGTVQAVHKKQKVVPAPKLPSTSDVQQAISKLGFELPAIDQALEDLYNTRKIITYPRSDSNYLTDGQAASLPALLQAASNIADFAPVIKTISSARITEIGHNKNYVNSKKSGPHSAITLTGTGFNFDTLPSLEQKIVHFVAQRLIQIFLDPEIIAETTILTANQKQLFKTTGKVIKAAGWTVLQSASHQDTTLPDVQPQDQVQAQDPQLKAGQTTPPPFYTDGSLVAMMKNVGNLVPDQQAKKVFREIKGLGTEATRTQIIQGLIKSKLIKKTKQQYHATAPAIQLINALKGLQIIDPITTATFETNLQQVEKGTLSAADYQTQVFDFVRQQVQIIHDADIPVLGQDQQAVQKTNLTYQGQSLVFHPQGKFGPYYEVQNSAKTKFSQVPNGHQLTEDEVAALLAGKTLKNLTFKWSKTKTKGQADLQLEMPAGKFKYTFAATDPQTITKHQGKWGVYYSYQGINISEKWSSHKFTEQEIKKLFNEENVSFEFTDKNKKKRKTTLKLNKSTHKLDFVN